jgi:hypothetical protein
MIDEQLHGRVTAERFDALMASVRTASEPDVSAMKIFVPRDAAACGVGADETASGHRGRGAAARHRHRAHSQWLARPALARAAG